jgi:hypothetical protein
MSRVNRLRIVKNGLVAVASLGVVFTAVMGFAHTEAGHPLLGLMGGALGMGAGDRTAASPGAKCPLGFGNKGTPEEKEAARRQFASLHAGDGLAQARPALGFQLDRTTRSDVTEWATAHHVTCSTPKSGSDLDCAKVPADALVGSPPGSPEPGFQSIWFTFGAGDKLIAAVGIRQDARVEQMSSAFLAVTGDVSREAGPPARTQGDASPASLASGSLYQASAEYRFRNYFAVARVTNMGIKGYVLTEEYRSLPES